MALSRWRKLCSLDNKTSAVDSTIDENMKFASSFGTFNIDYSARKLDKEVLQAILVTNHLCQCLHQAYVGLHYVHYQKTHRERVIYTVPLIMKTFADQLARDHARKQCHRCNKSKSGHNAILMYRLFVMLLRQCWKLAGVNFYPTGRIYKSPYCSRMFLL